MKHLLAWAAFVALGLGFSPAALAEDDVIKLGISAPMSGAAASWGIGADWVGQQAVKEINDHGGITAGGKTYKVQLTTYENGYNSADGGKAAQAMLNRDHVRFIIQAIGTAPVKALQSLSERQGALLMQVAWGKSVKGPQAPLTFTNSNTPFELFGPLFDLVKRKHPEAKTVAMLNPNDATGQEIEAEAIKQYHARGYTILASTWYERGTTEFQPVATKLAQTHADIMDLSGAPPADSGTVYKELAVQGWKGIKVESSGTGADAMVKVGGVAVEDTYMGNAADFGGPTATPVQQRLNAGALKALNEPVNILHMGAWDATMAIKAAIEKSNSIDPKVVAKTLPTIIFESSYGPTAFGGQETYGSPQQMLVPIIVTQIKNGQTVEVERIIPEELKQRLAAQSDKPMGLIAQLFVNTLQIGSVYVLFALGLTLVFGVMKVINFAHGQFFTLAALVIAATMPVFTARFGMPPWVDYVVCFILAMLAVGVLAAILYFAGFERYLRDLIGSFILSVGLLLLLDGVYLWAFGGAPRVVPKLLTGQVSLGGGAMETQRLVICGLALAATVGLYQLVQHTKLGWALRAVAEDREAAMLQGIRYRRISFYGFMIGSTLAAISGGLIAPLTAITPALGNDYLTKAFIIIIIGGLGSIPGAIVGGFLIAAIESIAGSLYDLSYATIAMFGLVIVFLLIRPQGILGHAQR